MATVVANMSMSLDGFIADPSDEVGPLFDWYNKGRCIYESVWFFGEIHRPPREA